MAATFVVTLREGFEAALLLGIVYACLDRFGARDHYRWVTLGGALGLAAVGLLTWHGWWMSRHAQALRGDVQRRVAEAEATRRLSVLGLIAFTGVFREGAETVLFLWGLVSQTAEGASWDRLAGGALGVATAAALGWAVFHGGARLSVRHFFTVTSVVLLLLGPGVFSTGLGQLQGLGLLPPADAFWDTSFLLSDRGLVGGVATGLLGYPPRPTPIESTGHAPYLVVAAALFFGGRRAARPR